jgi:RNA polymerase sigma-70 factor (ECF subfamily)
MRDPSRNFRPGWIVSAKMDLPPTQLARARRGDRDALAALVRHYQDRVYAVCVALAGADAEDCAQDALVKVIAAIHRFDPARGPSLGAWVMTIARRACIDRSRAARVVRYADRQVDAFAAASGDATAHDRDALVRRAVLDLPDEQRVVMVLRVWGELAYVEIAQIEGIPIGTVRSRLARARDALRAALSHLLTSLPEVHDDVG